MRDHAQPLVDRSVEILGDIEVLGLEFLAIHRGMLCVFPLQWESGMRDGNSGGR